MSRGQIGKACIDCLALVLLFGMWEFASYYYEGLQFVLPAPSNILSTLWEHAAQFRYHAFATLKEMLGGFLLAFSVAFPLAWLMALYGSLRTMLQPLFVAIQCVPMFALAPIMVLWFGWSYTAIVVPTALMIFFPLTISIYQGLCATPQALLDFFHLHEATPWQLFYKLQLPWALPHVFAGFRIAVSLAGIGAVAGEWAGAQEGLGLLMLESRRAADIDMTFSALACVTVLSLMLYGGATFLENKIKARHRQRKYVGALTACVLMMACILPLTSCQQKPKAPRQETLLLLDWLPNPNHVPLYAGMDKGFFEEEGISLKIHKVADPGDCIPYLTSKQVDLCLTYMPHTLNALARGAEVSPIGILIEEPLNSLIYRKGESIHQIDDLNDAVIGYCVDGHHTNFLQAVLRNRGIVLKDKRNVSFDLVSTLASKQVDAIYGAYWNIEMENLRSWGIETDYFPLSAFGVPTYYELIVLARKNGPYVDPEFTSAFQRALQRSINYAISHPEEAFQVYLDANPSKSIKTRTWEKAAWYKTIPTLAKNQYVDPSVWNEFVEWLIAQKLIQHQEQLLLKP